jgi:hypothetical protein
MNVSMSGHVRGRFGCCGETGYTADAIELELDAA